MYFYMLFFTLIFSLVGCVSAPELEVDEAQTNQTIKTTQTQAQKAQEEYKRLQIRHQ